MSAPATMLPFILKCLAEKPMSAAQLAKAGPYTANSLRKILTAAADDGLIHRILATPDAPRAYRYALGATSYQAVPRMTGHPNRRPRPPAPEIRRDATVAVLFPLPKPVARRDPMQALFFGPAK